MMIFQIKFSTLCLSSRHNFLQDEYIFIHFNLVFMFNSSNVNQQTSKDINLTTFNVEFQYLLHQTYQAVWKSNMQTDGHNLNIMY